jgi:predicted Rossmann fold nucleotide-binding protein DprA/Smf involved in DNA uptake
MSLSPNAQTILLLTAPLIAGRRESSSEPLTSAEYNRLARALRDRQRQPSDLLGPDADDVIRSCLPMFDGDRLQRLLGRGFLLSQVIDRWQARGIWVVSRADAHYPSRLKARLKEEAPPALYGCGEAAILERGGLAVVGSRHVDDLLVEYTENIGELAARSHCTVVSGGARGIDQAAMRGALRAGGIAVGMLADSLERAAVAREYREALTAGRLALVSPYDPAAGFNVGHAMQRNKLIYALADAALVVNADFEKGGTWAGAVEQLDKLRLIPVYVRSGGAISTGLEALRRKGAVPWPGPVTPEAFVATVTTPPCPTALKQEELAIADGDGSRSPAATPTPAEALFAFVEDVLQREIDAPVTEAEVAVMLQVSESQAKLWLERLVDEGAFERLSGPTRYRSAKLAGGSP